jgi:hypothetical protein
MNNHSSSKYTANVLIYKKDESGNIKCVCLVKSHNELVPYSIEYNPLSFDLYSHIKTKIGKDLGLIVNDLNQWGYLGHITSKENGVNIPCFCVDITETERDPASTREIIEVLFTEIYRHSDLYLTGMLFKFLKNVINDTRKERTQETSENAGLEEEAGDTSELERKSDEVPVDGEEITL